MDINEKVEQLVKITAALKNEVNELKSNDLNTKLDELESEKDELKNDIIDLRQSLLRQNGRILSLIREQSDKLVDSIDADKLTPHYMFNKKVSQHIKMFPIKSVKDLDDLENIVTDDNFNALVAVVQQLILPQGIIKNLIAVMSTECVVGCNVDGLHFKKRLLDYTKFMDILFQAAYYDGYSHKTFLDEVRRGLKLIKNRHNKNTFRTRQLLRQEQGQEYEDQDTEELDELMKTEEIFCD